MSLMLQLIIVIVAVAFVILVIDILADKVITFLNEKQERNRLEEAKRYESFFSGTGTIQR